MFPFRNLATKCDLLCSSGWYRALNETQPLESLRSHPVGRGGEAYGLWVNQLLATRQDVRPCSLHPPGLHRTAWCRQCSEERSWVHKTPRTGMWPRQRDRTLCFFIGYTSGPRRGRGERALLGRGAGWAPKLRWRVRLLSPHLGK